MPRKNAMKVFKRKRYNRYRKRFKGTLRSKFNPQIGFPKTTYVKMRYVDTYTISPGGLPGLQEAAWRANGIFDPNVAIGGHQPLGHDQWELFYDKYVVYRSVITVNFSCANNNSTPAGIGIYLSSSSTTTATTVNELQEQGKSNFLIVSPTTNGNAFTLNRKLRMTYNAKKWHNITNIKDAENLEAAFNADPADQTYFIIGYGNIDPLAASAPPDVVVNLSIDYYVLCKDPKELAQS